MAQVIDNRSLGAKGLDVLAQVAVCLPLGVALTVLVGNIYAGSVASPADGLFYALFCTALAWPMSLALSGAASAREPFTAPRLARAIYVRGPAWTAAGLLWAATWLVLAGAGFALGVLLIRAVRAA